MATPWYELLRNTLLSGVAPAAAAQAAVAAARTYALAITGFAELTHASGTATLNVGAPTIRYTTTTTNATPIVWTIPLTADKLTVLAYRIVGKVSGADGAAIIREGSKAVSRDSSFCVTLKTAPATPETFGELGDTGIMRANDTAVLTTANITWTGTSTGGVEIALTGVAATNIEWTCECWRKEY
jgi:hypothetical protein